LKDEVQQQGWICYAWCLMNNHYHFMIETPEGNLARGMQRLNGRYTQHFNRRHQRVGHVFQGRYKAILVEKESYLLELCRYVVLNSVRAGVFLLRRACNLSLKEVAVLAGISAARVSQIQKQVGDEGLNITLSKTIK